MKLLSASATISAKEPETEPREEPCWVQQQQDTEDTVKCSGAYDILNLLLGFMGFDVPPPKETETYATSVSLRPKNVYTSLNISITHGTLSDPIYHQGVTEQTFSVSTGDFSESEGSFFLDPSSKMDLVESDIILSVAWRGTPVDDNLTELLLHQQKLTVVNEKIKATAPGNGIMLVKYNNLSINYKININPREDTDEGFYESHLVINADGCDNEPFFYKIAVPECHEHNNFSKFMDIMDKRYEVEYDKQPPAPPKGGEDYACEYCLCTMDLKKDSYEGLCPGYEGEPSDRCKSGPNHKDC